MANQKRISPYTRLQETGRAFFRKMVLPRKRHMFTLPNARTKPSTWDMSAVYQRVEAAKQLGYEVVIETTSDDLVLKYVEKRPEYSDLPLEFN